MLSLIFIRWSLSGLFDREQYPNYFNTPGLFCWWGEAVRWEIAVLVVGTLCALALALPLRANRRPDFVASAISAPFVFGIAFSVFQIHMVFHTLGVAGWASAVSPDEMIYCELFSSHIGLFCSVALLALWLCGRAFRRAWGARAV